VGTRFSAPVQTNPVTHPASHTMRKISFLGYCGKYVALTTHPHLIQK